MLSAQLRCSTHGAEAMFNEEGERYCLKCVGGKLYSYLKDVEAEYGGWKNW